MLLFEIMYLNSVYTFIFLWLPERNLHFCVCSIRLSLIIKRRACFTDGLSFYVFLTCRRIAAEKLFTEIVLMIIYKYHDWNWFAAWNMQILWINIMLMLFSLMGFILILTNRFLFSANCNSKLRFILFLFSNSKVVLFCRGFDCLCNNNKTDCIAFCFCFLLFLLLHLYYDRIEILIKKVCILSVFLNNWKSEKRWWRLTINCFLILLCYW